MIGCTPQALGIKDGQIPYFEDGSKHFLMFGSAIWHDEKLKLDRCLQINKKRLEKLVGTDKTEALF